MTTMTQPEVRATSSLTFKWITAYFKKSGTHVWVHRTPEGDFLLANKWLMVRVPSHPDLFPYTYSTEWERATFLIGNPIAEEGGLDCLTLWDRMEAAEVAHRLTLTTDLREVPGMRKKPGTFYRRFTFHDGSADEDEDEQRLTGTIYLDKRFCDMLSPDLDELEGFLFEQITHQNGQLPAAVRVSTAYGHVAYLMPGELKNRGE